jgi:hypothetical protein
MAYVGMSINACTALTGKPEGKRPRRNHRHRCEDNMNINFKETG